MKNDKKLVRAFRLNEEGFINVPVKMSNVQFSRILHGRERGCSWCFPHGYETSNATELNYQRNWKKYRKTQWKLKKE